MTGKIRTDRNDAGDILVAVMGNNGEQAKTVMNAKEALQLVSDLVGMIDRIVQRSPAHADPHACKTK